MHIPLTAHPAKRRTRLAAVALLVLATGLSALAPQVASAANTETMVQAGGVDFERSLTLGGQPLVLNGAGVRAVAIFKGYAAGLYLPQRVRSADAATVQPGPKRLRMRLLRDVPAEEFVKAFHLGLERNSPGQGPALAERAQAFDKILQSIGTVRKSDEVLMDFLPGQGLLFSHNGRLLGAPISGDDFYSALLRVFLGEHVADERLRAGLLGG